MSDQVPSDPVEAADFDFLVKTAAPILVEHLRSVVTPKGKKGMNLRNCSDPQLLEIFFRLKRNQTYSSVAKRIQEDWFVCSHMPRNSLVTSLKTFKAKSCGPITIDQSDSLEKQLPAIIKRKAEEVDTRLRCLTQDLDTIGRLRWLCEQSLNRLLAWDKIAEENPKEPPLPAHGMELKACFEYHERLAKIETDLGLLKKVTQEQNTDGMSRLSRIFERLPDNGQLAITAMDKFIIEADRMTMTVVQNEEGVYKLERTTETDRIKGLALGTCGGINILHHGEDIPPE